MDTPVENADLPRFTRLSDADGTRAVPTAWQAASDQKPRDVHFMILPAYIRYNDQTPLSPNASIDPTAKKDMLFVPLGYTQIVSSLKKFTNHRVEVIDPYASYVAMNRLETWLEAEYARRELSAPDYILIGGMSTSWPVIKRAVQAIRKTFPNAKIFCGGTAAGLHYDLLLRKVGVDVAIIGEAEFVAADLFHHLDDYSKVPGIAFLDKDGKTVRNPSPPPHDLNDAPEPAWDLLNIEEYIASGQRMVGWRGLPINTSMGCPFACKFCYVPGGRNMRYLTTDNVVDRMRRMKDRFDLDYVAFYDDILFVDKDWMWELGEKLLKADLGVMWNCASRVNLFSEKDAPLLSLLRRAGLVRISFGIESGSPKILKNMGKTGVSPDKAKATLKLVRRFGIRATASMLIGFPGESPETIGETVEFCKDNLLYPSFYLLQPFPGTDVYDKYVRQSIDEEHYLDMIADYREGEKFPINLTEMADDELKDLRLRAEAEMKKFHFGKYLSYYGIEAPRHLLRDGRNVARRWLRGSMFLTP